jgi:hypothetical protein
VRKGALIDATPLEASVKPPSGKDGTVSARDPAAGRRKKNGKSSFGYKAHLAVDEGSEIIRGALLTSADLHDSQPGVCRILCVRWARIIGFPGQRADPGKRSAKTMANWLIASVHSMALRQRTPACVTTDNVAA